MKTSLAILPAALLCYLMSTTAQVYGVNVPPPNGPGHALSFDGVDDHVAAPAGVWFSGDFTVEGWVFVRSYNNWSRLLDFGNVDGAGEGVDNVLVAISEGTTGRPHFHVLSGSTVGPGLVGPNPLPLNQWSHLACVLSGTTGTIYLDGAAVVSGPLQRPRAVSRLGCYIGRSNWPRDSHANAIFDEVRLWNVARTGAQIREAMRRQLFGNEAGLVAGYRFDEGSGLSAGDATGFAANTAVLVNGPAWTASTIRPFAPTITTGTFDWHRSWVWSFGDPNGAATRGQHQWGANAAYGLVTPTHDLGSGGCCPEWNDFLPELRPGVTYHYRAVATNLHGASYGLDETFRLTLTHVVSNLGDSGAGSLRQAVLDSEHDDQIVFAPLLTGVIALTSGPIAISHDLEILGPGASVLTISASNLSRIFRVFAADAYGPEVLFSGLTLRNGKIGTGALDGGGAIKVEAGEAAVYDCVLAENGRAGTIAARGGAVQILNNSYCDMVRCTLVGNQASGGAAISVENGELRAFQCTVAGNRASPSVAVPLGGAIRVVGGNARLSSCTVASNSATRGVAGILGNSSSSIYNCIVALNTGDDLSGVNSGGYNVIGADAPGASRQPTDWAGVPGAPLDPRLGPLQNNGGHLPTMALLPGSPALEAGDDTTLAWYWNPTDQRGFPRRSGCHVDIGAYEATLPGADCTRVVNGNEHGGGSLREAIAQAAAGASIKFAPGVSVVTLGSELIIDKDLSIEGPGADVLTLSGGFSTRLFLIGAGRVVRLSGLTLAHGRVIGTNGMDGLGMGWNGESGQSVEGGAILNLGDLTVADCVFSSNAAFGGEGGNGVGDARFIPAGQGGFGGHGAGGAIANHGTLTLLICAFVGNNCGGGDGGGGGTGFNEGSGLGGSGQEGGVGFGGAIVNLGLLAANQCAFVRNGAVGGSGGHGADGRGYGGGGGRGANAHGGAIMDAGEVTLSNCTFSENATQGGHGGDAGNGNSGSFPGGGHAGQAFGGALDLWSVGVLVNCTVANNRAWGGAGGEAPDPGFNGGLGTNAGGGVCVSGNGVIAINTLISGNRSVNEPGDGPDAAGIFTSLGHNFIGVTNGSTGWLSGDRAGRRTAPLDPLLGPLAATAGLSYAMVPLRGSPLIDAGDDTVLGPPLLLTTDQRGGPRRGLSHVDIGAVEVGSALRLTQVRRAGAATDIFFTSEAGFPHRLESKDALTPGPWTPFGPLAVVGNGGVMTVRDTRPASPTSRFYRAVMTP